MIRSVIVSFILVAISSLVYAQGANDVLDTLRKRLSEKPSNKQEGIYLHLDKSTYTSNEHIWFTGYVLSQGKFINEHHTLYVLLVNLLSKKIVSNERFIISEGIGKGQIMVTDSMPAGEYQLIAYTNTFLQNQAEPVYAQTISVRSPYKEDISVTIDSFETSTAGNLTILPKATSVKWGLPAGGQMKYELYSGHRKIVSGKEKIDNSGNIRIHIPDSLAHSKLELTGEVSFKKEVIAFRRVFELPVLPVHIRFFPEGGNLIDGHQTRMAFEISAGGKALAVAGDILQNDLRVASFQSNQYGLGSVTIIPDGTAKYSVVLHESRKHILHTEFPEILQTGFSVTVNNAVFGDSLQVIIQPPAANTECVVLLHDQRREFFAAAISIKGAKGLLKIPVWELPDGVATLTVFDSKGLPVAERAVFLKGPEAVKIAMSVDSATYVNRSKVTLKIKVTGDEGEPIPASFSFAAVLSARIDSLRYADIDRYFYFDRFVPVPGTLPPAVFFRDKRNVDHLLLTRFWTRYKWNDLVAKSHNRNYAGDFGHVNFRQKKPKQPIDLIVLGDVNVIQVLTDSSGGFSLPSDILQGAADSKLLVSVVDKKRSADYELFLESDLQDLNASLIARPFQHTAMEPDVFSVEEKKDKSMLQGVVVTATRTLDEPGVFRSVNCNDYVCIYNILNCENHPMSGSKPVNGGMYQRRTAGKLLETVTYVGCEEDQKKETPFLKQIKATNAAKEFYRADYIKFNPEDKEDFTTLFWSHQIETNEKGEAEITFFTNDLKGKFICILQGMADGVPVSSRTTFTVK